MALPKGKISKARGRSRRANWKLTLPGIVECPQCHEKKLAHRVCKNCGYYKGVIAQIGSPMDIYYHPVDEFVADFIGEANFLKGLSKGMRDNACVVDVDGRECLVATDGAFEAGRECEIVLRPEAIRIGETGMLPCKVELSCFMGSYQNYHVRVGDTLVKISDNCPVNKRVFAVGEDAYISFDKECAHVL